MQQLSELELDLLLLLYTYSDQYGVVDMNAVKIPAKAKLGVVLPPEQIILKQKHIDALMTIGNIIPDTRQLISEICDPLHSLKKKKRKHKK